MLTFNFKQKIMKREVFGMKMKKIFCVIISCVLLICLSISVSAAEVLSVQGSNWMSAVADDVSLKDLSIPGTHDSATKYVSLGIKSRCQDLSIREQLWLGVRFLDIRLQYDESCPGKIKLVHAVCDCYRGSGFGAPKLTLVNVLNECYSFLRENPAETILFMIKKDFGSDEEKLAREFKNTVEIDNNMWYTQNSLPTMGEARGKIVLLNRLCENAADYFGEAEIGVNLSAWESQKQKIYSPVETPQLSTDGKTISNVTIQDRYKLKPSLKWEKAVKPLLEKEKEKGKFVINFLSTASGVSPQISAEYINEKFLDFDIAENRCLGVVLFDFADKKLVEKVYMCNSPVFTKKDGITSPGEMPTEKSFDGKIKFFNWQPLINLFK